MNVRLTLPPEVTAVIEFGSVARGDDDDLSDRDICMFVRDLPDRAIARLKRRIAMLYRADEGSVSAYRTSTVRRMAIGGSLFLWHLKLEGRILFSRPGAVMKIYDRLEAYSRFSVDLLLFQELCDDLRDATLARRRALDLFDLHVSFLIARNVCMLLTVHAGQPTFGRSTVFHEAVRRCGRLPMSARLFGYLVRAHLVYIRGADVGIALPSLADSRQIVSDLDALLRLAWRRF
jgi:predicted nucleotidyltransferase